MFYNLLLLDNVDNEQVKKIPELTTKNKLV